MSRLQKLQKTVLLFLSVFLSTHMLIVAYYTVPEKFKPTNKFDALVDRYIEFTLFKQQWRLFHSIPTLTSIDIKGFVISNGETIEVAPVVPEEEDYTATMHQIVFPHRLLQRRADVNPYLINLCKHYKDADAIHLELKIKRAHPNRSYTSYKNAEHKSHTFKWDRKC